MIFKDQWSIKDKLVGIISLCIFIQLLICNSLWIEKNRLYPKISVFENIQFTFVDSAGLFFFCLILLCLLSFAIGKIYRFNTFLFLLLIALFVINDINRLQIWIYELIAMLSVLLISRNNNTKATINGLQIILICVYFWGGIHKLNIYFAEDTFPWLLEPLGINDFAGKNHFLAYFAAVLESLIGVGLMFRPTRQAAVVIAMSFHIIILIILGPLGHNWNHVVWPWNVCSIVLLYLLFYKKRNSLFDISREEFKSNLYLPIVIVLFGIMPVFNFFGAWDEQLSFKMYSGISPEGIFYYYDQQTICIPSEVKEKFVHINLKTNKQSVILDDWIFYTLKVAPYKSKKRILQVGKKLCQCIENPELAGLELLEVNRWEKGKDSFISFSCFELLNYEKEAN